MNWTITASTALGFVTGLTIGARVIFGKWPWK